MIDISKGRIIASNGYVKLLMPLHPSADSKGYVYEHRVIAERMMGRPLGKSEIVHHKDHDKANNDILNLEVVRGTAEHFVKHRKRSSLRLPGEENPLIQCKCGCGTEFTKYDSYNRPRTYVSGHNPQEKTTQLAILQALRVGPLSCADLRKITNRTSSAINVAAIRLLAENAIVRAKVGVYGLPGTPIRENRLIKCACGCGQELFQFDRQWRMRRYLPFHRGGSNVDARND